MNQISSPDRNLDRPQRIAFVARRDNLAGVRGPGLVRLGPGGVENNHFGFAESGWQRKLLVANPDFVRFQQRTVFE